VTNGIEHRTNTTIIPTITNETIEILKVCYDNGVTTDTHTIACPIDMYVTLAIVTSGCEAFKDVIDIVGVLHIDDMCQCASLR